MDVIEGMGIQDLITIFLWDKIRKLRLHTAGVQGKQFAAGVPELHNERMLLLACH
jgi:hypothetical protein